MSLSPWAGRSSQKFRCVSVKSFAASLAVRIASECFLSSQSLKSIFRSWSRGSLWYCPIILGFQLKCMESDSLELQNFVSLLIEEPTAKNWHFRTLNFRWNAWTQSNFNPSQCDLAFMAKILDLVLSEGHTIKNFKVSKRRITLPWYSFVFQPIDSK